MTCHIDVSLGKCRERLARLAREVNAAINPLRSSLPTEDEDGSDAPPSSGSEESLPQPRPPPETGRKIRNARRKFEGENPAAVMIDDLAQVTVTSSRGRGG